MNEAKIDHLLQVTAPRAGWPALTPIVGRGEQPAFDDHLVYATAPPASAEPPRTSDTRPLENSPPADSLPWRREVTPSDVEENDNHLAAQNTSSNDADGESLASDETEASAAESIDPEANIEIVDAEPTGIDAPHNGETDEVGAETVAELAAATDLAAKSKVVSKSLAWHKSDTEGAAAAPSIIDAPADPITKQSTSTRERHTSDGLQPVTSADTSAATDNVVQAEVLPAQSESEQAAAFSLVGATIHGESGDKQSVAEVAVTPLRSIGGDELRSSISKRLRPPVREPESKGDQSVATSRDENQESNASAKTEHQAIETQESAVESREMESPRKVAGRQASQSDALNNKANSSVVTTVQSAAIDTVVEAAKPDASDEPVRVTPQPAPRSDALLNPIARLHRGGTSVARSQSDAKSEEAPLVDATRFVSRVAKAFHTAQERGGTLQLRLSPPELGALRLELIVQDGVLAAKLEAETPAARRVLLDHLPALRDRLAEQNIRIESFDVDVRQEGNGHSPASPQHGRHANQHPHQGSSHRQPPRQPVPTPESATVTPAAAGPITDTQINLVA